MALPTLIPKKKKKTTARSSVPAPIPIRRYTPQIVPSQHPLPAQLSKKLAGLRRKYRFVRSAEIVAKCCTAAMILLTAQMFLDWLVNLSWLVRAVILCGDVALLVFYLRKHLFPLLYRPPNQEACALMVEKQWPRFRGRLIATVQFAKPRLATDPPRLITALQEETAAQTAHLDFGEIVPMRPLTRRIGLGIVVAVFWVGLLVVTWPGSLALLERVFLLPAKVPRKTEVICLSGNKVVPAGDSVLLEAQARGIIPSHGQITLHYDSGRIQEVTLDPERDHPDRFSLKIDRLDEGLSYSIQLNDGTSDTYDVKAIPRPNVLSIDCEQDYPPYTGLEPIKRTVENLALLAGSRLKIHAVTNSKIEKAAMKLVGIDKQVPLKIGGPKGQDLTGEFDIPASGLTGFSILLTNEAGITSGDDTQYRIDLIPDRPPTVEITYPERLQELYTLQAKPTIAFKASDDYGLAKISLCYRIVKEEATETKKIEMDLGQDHPQTMQRRYEWNLSAVQPPFSEETTVEYWMEAQDTNNVTGPGITESEHHTIRIVSPMEKRAEIMSRLMDKLSTITDISENQEKVNKALGDVIQGKKEQK